MSRTMAQLLVPAALDDATVVCGCGGGAAVRDVLPAVLHHARRLVLDADGLNTVASDAGLTRALRARAARSLDTVLTPHPLEAARLLNAGSRDVQSDRLRAAHQLADAMQCTVLLKGSGSIVASPGQHHVDQPDRRRAPGHGRQRRRAGRLDRRLVGGPCRNALAPTQWLRRPRGCMVPPSSTRRAAGPLRASHLVEAMVSARDALQAAS